MAAAVAASSWPGLSEPSHDEVETTASMRRQVSAYGVLLSRQPAIIALSVPLLPNPRSLRIVVGFGKGIHPPTTIHSRGPPLNAPVGRMWNARLKQLSWLGSRDG